MFGKKWRLSNFWISLICDLCKLGKASFGIFCDKAKDAAWLRGFVAKIEIKRSCCQDNVKVSCSQKISYIIYQYTYVFFLVPLNASTYSDLLQEAVSGAVGSNLLTWREELTQSRRISLSWSVHHWCYNDKEFLVECDWRCLLKIHISKSMKNNKHLL